MWVHRGDHRSAWGGTEVSSTRKSALVAGVFFIVAAAAAIVGLILYQDVLHRRDYILGGSGSDAPVFLGAFFEIVLAISVVGTAVTLFPIVRRQNEGAALGYVAGRVLEATVIVVGIMSLLSVITSRPATTSEAPPATRWSRCTTGPSCSARTSPWESTRRC